jgi:hypothetical protein
MTDYKLLTRETPQGPRAAILVGGNVHDVEGYARVVDILDDWDAAQPRLESAAAGAKGGTPLAQVKLLAPVLYPSAIFCAGANYSDHEAEMDRAQNRGTSSRRRASSSGRTSPSRCRRARRRSTGRSS